MKLLSRLKTLWALSAVEIDIDGKFIDFNPVLNPKNKKPQMAQIVSRVDPLADIIEKQHD